MLPVNGNQVPVQVHRRDPYKQKRPKMLVQVQNLDRYVHPLTQGLRIVVL